MNEDILAGKWKQMKGSFKQKWGKLTDDDMNYIEGSSEKLLGKLQERYGWNKDEAKKEFDEALKETDKAENKM